MKYALTFLLLLTFFTPPASAADLQQQAKQHATQKRQKQQAKQNQTSSGVCSAEANFCALHALFLGLLEGARVCSRFLTASAM